MCREGVVSLIYILHPYNGKLKISGETSLYNPGCAVAGVVQGWGKWALSYMNPSCRKKTGIYRTQDAQKGRNIGNKHKDKTDLGSSQDRQREKGNNGSHYTRYIVIQIKC